MAATTRPDGARYDMERGEWVLPVTPPTQSSHTEVPTTPGNTDAPGTGPLLTDSPAFPVRGPDMLGLTKREWYAGMAMQGIAHGVGDGDQRRIARWSVACADALIAALEQPR